MTVFVGCVPWVGLPYREVWLLAICGALAAAVLVVFAATTRTILPVLITLVLMAAAIAGSAFILNPR